MTLDKAPLARRLLSLHSDLAQVDDGDVATYIPELGHADPSKFGLAIVTADSDVYEAGDSRDEFSIQSASKPFVYAMALMDIGESAVLDRVGIEPTGDPFNAVTLDAQTGRPLNPMVNAGAILTSSLVAGNSAAERTERIRKGLSAFAGRELSIDASVKASEYGTSNRNRAISYLMRGSGALELEVEDTLETYISQCSMLVSAKDLATMGATLAAAGRNPITGEQVVPDHLIEPVLSIMSTCGMYDGAGAWMYRVGLPAKSGVAGGVLAALPNQLGIASWSPKLDQHGNSVRGVRALEQLSEDLGLHVFSPTGGATSPIRRETSTAVLKSRAGRSLIEKSQLDEYGERNQIVELGGAVGILAAQIIVEGLLAAERVPDVRCIVLDAADVGYLHPGALKIIREALSSIMERGTTVRVVDDTVTESGAPDRWPCEVRARLDEALEECEDELLASLPGGRAAGEAEVPLDECEVLRDLSPADFTTVTTNMRRIRVPEGEPVTVDGEPVRGLLWVVAGELDIFAILDGRRSRIQGIGGGRISGVMSLVNEQQAPRHAVAAREATVMLLDAQEIDRLTQQEPALVTEILKLIAIIMVGQQRRFQEVVLSLTKYRSHDGAEIPHESLTRNSIVPYANEEPG